MSGRIPRRGRVEKRQLPLATSRHEREIECARGGVAVLVRVSGKDQAVKSKGSIAFQRAQLRHVARWGVDPKSVRVFEALGQSAKQSAPRAFQEDLLGEVRDGSVRMVIIALTSRIGRSWDSKLDQLFEALKEVNGGIVAQGRFYDLLDYEDSHRLREQILQAEKENEERARIAAIGRYEQAKTRQLAVPLPTGLVWASPSDPSFRASMKEAGLVHLLSEARLQQHLTHVERDGVRLYVFPDPREKCWRAATFILQAIRQTRSLAGTLEAIISASTKEYPRPGYLPSTRRSVFRQEEIRWIRIRGRSDGRDDQAFRRIRDWSYSPALYGIYSYEPRKLLPIAHLMPDPVEEVWVPGAFPALLGSAEYEATIGAITDPARRNLRKGPEPRARLNLVPRLTCCHPLPDGSCCGLALSVSQPTDAKTHRYVSPACGKRGHASTIPGAIDDTVQRILLDAFRPEQVRTEFRIALSGENDVDRAVRDAEAALSEAIADAEYYGRMARQAHTDRDGALEAQWLKSHRAAVHARDDHERALHRLRRSQTEIRRVGDGEQEEILCLANDFPSLLAASREHHELASLLVGPLIRSAGTMRLGTGVHWVEVQFPTGASMGEIHMSGRTVPSTAAMRTAAHAALAKYLEPARRKTFAGNARALAAATGVAEQWMELIGRRRGGAAWTAEDVLSVAYQYRDVRDTTVSAGGRTVEEWALRWDRAPSEVGRAALQGRLGLPSFGPDGGILLAPGPDQLRATFPDVLLSTHETKSRLVRVGDVAVERRLNPRGLIAKARESGVLASDDSGTVWIPAAAADMLATPDLAVGDPAEGWFRFAQVASRLPGVKRKPLERVTISGWPGLGPASSGDRWFWLDGAVEGALREPTVGEWLSKNGLTDHVHSVRLRTDFQRRMSARARINVSSTMLDYATRRRRITAFSAAVLPYGSRRQWLIVPASVWDASGPDDVRLWLRGSDGAPGTPAS